MIKESHLAHVIIASSDGYFLYTVYNDSRLKKTSRFYKVDYLPKEDMMEWLLNLEKYSKIKDYTLTPEDAGKIWNTLGGSMWEVQEILTDLFTTPLDEVLSSYILYFDPTEGLYYPQGKSYQEGIRLFFESMSNSP
ncbi:MAG: ATP-binding protein [Candidatus Aminicenantes bacterium]|jgi:hypothetical protein